MSSEKRHIDDFLRGVFRSHDTESAADGWNDFNAAFQARKKKKRRRGFWLFTLAVLAAATASWLSIANNEKPLDAAVTVADSARDKNNIQAQTKDDNTVPAEPGSAASQNSAVNNAPANTASANAASGNVQNNNVPSAGNTAQAGNTANNTNHSRVKSSPEPVTGQAANTSEPASAALKTPADEMPSIVPRRFIRFAHTIINPEAPLLVSISPPDFAKMKFKKLPSFIVPGLQLVFNVSPTVTYNHYSNTEDDKVHKDLQNNIAASIKPKTTVNFGVNLRYNVKNLSFGSGVEYYSVGQSGQYTYTVSDVPVFDIDGSIAGYLTLSDTFKVKQNNSASTSFTYVQMPVSVGYAFPLSGHTRLILSGGGNLQYRLGEKGFVPGAQYMEMTKAGEGQKSNKVNGSVMMALGFQCRLNRRFDLELATRYSQQLRPQYDKSSLYNNRINTIGLNIGLIYNIIP